MHLHIFLSLFCSIWLQQLGTVIIHTKKHNTIHYVPQEAWNVDVGMHGRALRILIVEKMVWIQWVHVVVWVKYSLCFVFNLLHVRGPDEFTFRMQ